MFDVAGKLSGILPVAESAGVDLKKLTINKKKIRAYLNEEEETSLTNDAMRVYTMSEGSLPC